MNTDTVKVGKKRNLQTAKKIAGQSGLWMAAAAILFLLIVFVKPYHNVIDAIPSPEYESVRLFYIWVLRLGIVFLAVLAGILWIYGKKPGWLFPATVICLGLFYMMILPPFSAPDEPRHFVSAYRLSNQIMGKQAVADEAFLSSASDKEKEYIARGGNVLVREQDGREEPYASVGRDSYALMLRELFTKDAGSGTTVRFEAPVNTTPVVYLPQALGISFARVLHLGYIPLIYMGRLFNLLAFAGMAWLAVRIMPFKKEMFMAVSLLPMTLHLAASLSYDTSLIGLSLLFFAWCFYLAYEKKQIGIRDTVILGLLLVLLEPCKIVYLPLAGICLLIPASKFGEKKRYWISVAAVIGVMALAIFLINNVVLSAWIQDTENIISWEGGSAGYTIQDILKEPYQAFLIYYETLVTQLDYYQATMLGGYLGNLDPNLTVPYFCLYLLWGILIVSSVRRVGDHTPFKPGQKVWIAVLTLLSFCLVLTSMLLGWTPKGFTYIAGIQGRYFLPILPLILLMIYGDNLTIKRDYSKGIYYLECFVSIYALVRICSVTCIR